MGSRMERPEGIEPSPSVWKTVMLPLTPQTHYGRSMARAALWIEREHAFVA